MVGCVLAGALGTSCGDIHEVPADGGAGNRGGDGGRGGGGAGGAAGSAVGAAGAGAVGAAGTGPTGGGGGGRGGGAAGNTAGTAGAGTGSAGAGGAGAGGGGRGGGAAGNVAGTAGAGSAGAGGGGRGGGVGGNAAGAAGAGATGAGGGGRGGGAAGNVAGTAGTGSAGAGGGAGCRRELLTNGEFDLGPIAWSEAPLGTRLIRRSDDAEVASHQVTPQSGLYVLRLGAPSTNYVVHYVEQYANIPSGAQEITISGHLQVRTDEPPDDVYDEAYVQLFDESMPATPFFRSAPRWSNLTQANNWTPFSFTVNAASVAGKQMVFRIVADLDSSVATYFYFDTLSVAVTRCAPG